MPVNLTNETALSAYLVSLIFNNGEEKAVTKENFQELSFVKTHQDLIAKSMVAQWLKKSVRRYLDTIPKEELTFLLQIRNAIPTDPKWVHNALKEGREIYQFNAHKIPPTFRTELLEISNFLYKEAFAYLNNRLQVAEKGKGTLNLKLDALIGNYPTFIQAQKQAVTKKEKMEKERRFYEESKKGTVLIATLSTGMQVVELKTENALDFEGTYMGHCAGQGGYDKLIKEDEVSIFSFRDKKGNPYITMEVLKGMVLQCNGRNNKPPAKKYLPTIQEFIKENKLDVRYSVKSVGLIQQDDTYYSVFDLPDNFKIKSHSLDLTDSNVAGINLNVQVNFLNLSHTTGLMGDLNFFRIKKVDLSWADLTKITSIKGPSDFITFSFSDNLPATMDFSDTKRAIFTKTNFKNVEQIKWPKEKLTLSGVYHLPKILDFSTLDELILNNVDFSEVEQINWPTKITGLDINQLPKPLQESYKLHINGFKADGQKINLMNLKMKNTTSL